MSSSSLTELDKSIVRLARDRLCILRSWLMEHKPPVTPLKARSILTDAIRCQSILLGEGTKEDIDWLLDRRSKKEDPETEHGSWNLCPVCESKELESKKIKLAIKGVYAGPDYSERIGQSVKVIQGIHKGLSGVIFSVSAGTVQIRSDDARLSQPIPVSDIDPVFVGSRVHVVSGYYAGTLGRIVNLSPLLVRVDGDSGDNIDVTRDQISIFGNS